MAAPLKLKIALDWTPNSNHCGFYVAKSKGFYSEVGLDVEILPPSSEYSKDETPARRVVNGLADFCVAPTESVISCWTSGKAQESQPVCVATLLQRDTSAIVALKSNPSPSQQIISPASLVGKRYASYAGRFEMAIVNQMILNAGGTGQTIETLPPKLDCFEKVVEGNAEATWVFLGWEGIMAQRRGVEILKFTMEDYGIPYGYSPCLLAARKYLIPGSDEESTLRKFLSATARGYSLAHLEPATACDAIMSISDHPTLYALGRDFVLEAQEYLSGGRYLLDDNFRWGCMKAERWEAFFAFIADHNLLGSDGNFAGLRVDDLYTNVYIEEV